MSLIIRFEGSSEISRSREQGFKPSVKLIRMFCDWMLALPNSKRRTDFRDPRVNLNECRCETKINQEVKERSTECKKTTYIYITDH